jgi:hypothetical protein
MKGIKTPFILFKVHLDVVIESQKGTQLALLPTTKTLFTGETVGGGGELVTTWLLPWQTPEP